MVYRMRKHKPPKPERTLVDVTTPSRIFVHNGTIAHLAFPCWYQEVHRPMPIKPHNKYLHDHLGWPQPTRPDRSCQVWVPFKPEPCLGIDAELPRHFHPRRFIDLKGLVPIHLVREGYTEFDVHLEASEKIPTENQIETEAWVDPSEDWVVRVEIFAHDENALKHPMKYKMTVFASINTEDHLRRRDIVALTDLIVLPSSFNVEDYQEDEDE